MALDFADTTTKPFDLSLDRPKYSEPADLDLFTPYDNARMEHYVTEEDYIDTLSNRVNDRDIPTVSDDSVILWLLTDGDNAKRKSYIRKVFQRNCPHLLKDLRFVTVGRPKQKIVRSRTKTTVEPAENYKEIFNQSINSWLPRARVVVINSFDILVCLLSETTGHGNKKTLAAFRGSVYLNEFFAGIPALVIEDAFKCYAPNFSRVTGKDEVNKAQSIQYFDYDIDKLARIHKNPLVCENIFDRRFEVVSGEGNLSSRVSPDNLAETEKSALWYNKARFERWLEKQTLLALDKETSMGHISCISVTGISNNDPSTKKTWVVPHVAPTAQYDPELSNIPMYQNNEYMPFLQFRELLAKILTHDAPKIWHNGNYDAHYAMLYNLPPKGLNYDTQYMWHSYRAQMPQSLASVASIFCDDYYYWKDEIKGGSGEKKTQVKYSVPITRRGLMTYWRYAGLDTHMCMTAFLRLLPIVNGTPWAAYNYSKEYALLRGPLFAASYRGINFDRAKFWKLISAEETKAQTALENLRIASNGIVQTDTNAELVTWLYDTLGANPPPKKAGKKTAYSVDQKQLILVAEQHPIFEKAIDYIRKHREPQKLVDMYKPLQSHHGRLVYGYSLAPYTGRLASRGSSFWKGTNVQNVPASMREFMTADPGKVLLDIDYSQADLYHFAVACGDNNMMRNVFDDRDTHTVHVETILGLPYEEGMRLRKSEDKIENAYMNDSIHGLRQIIKKLTHGGNYGMTPATVYLNAGRAALDSAAKALGISTAGWKREDYYDFCDKIMIPYFKEYSKQKPWRKEILRACVENEGLATCFGGLTVYFDDYRRKRDHDQLTRALLAFYGQGGTAGMINESMIRMHYGNKDSFGKPHVAVSDDTPSFLDEHNIDLLLQTHDSLTYQVPVEVLKDRTLIDYILTAMELTCNFNGIEYKVPCEVNVGHSWSKGMPEIKPHHNDRDLVASLLENYVKEGLIYHAT